MKIQKFNENKIPKNKIKSTLKDYNELVFFLKPIIIWKYYDIANNIDEDYEAEYGSIPDPDVPESELFIENISDVGDKILFNLATYTKYGSIDLEFEIYVSYEEIENFETITSAKKYNM